MHIESVRGPARQYASETQQRDLARLFYYFTALPIHTSLHAKRMSIKIYAIEYICCSWCGLGHVRFQGAHEERSWAWSDLPIITTRDDHVWRLVKVSQEVNTYRYRDQ